MKGLQVILCETICADILSAMLLVIRVDIGICLQLPCGIPVLESANLRIHSLIIWKPLIH